MFGNISKNIEFSHQRLKTHPTFALRCKKLLPYEPPADPLLEEEEEEKSIKSWFDFIGDSHGSKINKQSQMLTLKWECDKWYQ